MADKICLHRPERSFSRFSTAAHFTEPDQTVISLDFNDRTNEPSPVTAVRMSERSFERDGYGSGSDVGDLHCLVRSLNIFHLSFLILSFVACCSCRWRDFRRSFFISRSRKTIHEVTRSTTRSEK